MAYVVWRVLMKKYSKVRLGLQKGPTTYPQSTANIVSFKQELKAFSFLI